jgi:hypothetical protein
MRFLRKRSICVARCILSQGDPARDALGPTPTKRVAVAPRRMQPRRAVRSRRRQLGCEVSGLAMLKPKSKRRCFSVRWWGSARVFGLLRASQIHGVGWLAGPNSYLLVP